MKEIPIKPKIYDMYPSKLDKYMILNEEKFLFI